jgi:hypothetical protein
MSHAGGIGRRQIINRALAFACATFDAGGAEVKKILDHLGVDSRAPRITPARGPPLGPGQEQSGALCIKGVL